MPSDTLVFHAYACIYIYTSDIQVTPLLKILGPVNVLEEYFANEIVKRFRHMT